MSEGRPPEKSGRIRRTKHGVRFGKEYHPRAKHLIRMLWTVATTTLIIDGTVVYLGSLRRRTEPLGSPNSLQLVNGMHGPNMSGIIESIPVELHLKGGMTTLSGLFPLQVRRACFVVL